MTKKKNNKSAIRTEKDKKVPRLNRAIYSATDATYGYPKGLGLIAAPSRAGIALLNPDDMWYEVTDSVADAAWRKRLGLSYDERFLPANKDGSYRLPKNVEREIPVDTTFIKNRIKANQKLADSPSIMGEDWTFINNLIKEDTNTLNSLRHTYRTGEPVTISEFSANSRKLAKDGKVNEDADSYKSPLNILKDYTIQYNPKDNTMMYRDIYDFNGFESFVPGEPFDIKGSIPLRKYGLGGPAPSELFKGVKLAPGKQVGGAASTLRNIGRNFTSSLQGIGSAMGGAAIGALGTVAGKGTSSLIGGGLSSGAGNAITGVTGTIGGAISSVNPLLGGAVSLVGGAIGGAVNRVFGSKLNKEKIASVEGDINRALAFTSNAGDFDSLTTNFENLQGIQGFSQSDIGKDGWASNKAKNKFRELNRQAEEAEAWQQAALEENAANIANTNQQLLEANYTAYGGPLDMKYTGVMSPFGNQFKDGGIKDVINNTWEERKTWGTLFKGLPLLLKYNKPKYGGGKFGGAGASSLTKDSPDTYSLVKDTLWVPYRETFNDAFGRARAAGLEEFMFDNKLYTTELGDNPDSNRAGEERVVEGIIPVERTVKKKKANGGQLFTNGVTMIGNGGTHEYLEGQEYDVTEEEIKLLKKLGYEFEYL